ncbi:proline-rich protein [Streptomyces viridosporus ATCC 14672]|uniref:Proline-rich protein n=2 Tax=Streptomyces viridosporus TaxID=67581 RepID=D6A6F0_STRV1|nr:proline-rich protein [Streptomyces viridosporus ATCC 14672]
MFDTLRTRSATQRNPGRLPAVASDMVGTVPDPPPPVRRPAARPPLEPGDEVRLWYENALGWPTVPGRPVRLAVGERFDVLDLPAEAGHAALERLGRAGRGFPVAAQGGRMRLLVAVGSAEELPGLLDWLEWGSLELDLAAIGAGGLMDAPRPPGHAVPAPPLPPGRGHGGTQGAAVWLRPPEPGCEVEASLPTLSAMGGRGDAPDLVRLVNTVVTQVHRIRLRRSCA